MAKYRGQEFAKFACDGKRFRSGELLMLGNEVFSYAMKIAVVDRDKKSIKLNETKVSRTTSRHQGAITLGMIYLPATWTLEKQESPL